jgi:hypothetical protein
MIKLKPEKSRMAVFAYSFAIFSPSLSISSQKKDINSSIGINSERVNPSEAEKDLQSPPRITNGSLNQLNKSFGAYCHALQFNGIIGGQYISWFSRVKINFHKKWSSISTTMIGFFKKMMEIYHFDNQSLRKAKLKYTAIFFLYN